MSYVFNTEQINQLFPVEQIQIFENGCYIIKRGNELRSATPVRGERKPIVKLTNTALARLAWTSQTTQTKFHSMLTMTYGKYYPENGKQVKEDIRMLIQFLKRQNYTRNYLWFLEFQKRGAPHVHVMVQADAITPKMRVGLATWWMDRQINSEWMFDHNFPDDIVLGEAAKLFKFNVRYEVWSTIRKPDGWRRYVMKYACKTNQKDVPEDFQNVGRFWGCDQETRPRTDLIVDITEDEARDWLRGKGHKAAEWGVLPKHLFNVPPNETTEEEVKPA